MCRLGPGKWVLRSLIGPGPFLLSTRINGILTHEMLTSLPDIAVDAEGTEETRRVEARLDWLSPLLSRAQFGLLDPSHE